MNNFLKRLARMLPDDILFTESYRHAKKVNEAFKQSKDKIDFISSYQNQKLKFMFNLAAGADFYKYLKGRAVEIDKLPFISKEVVLKSFDRMIVSKLGADYITTGGTSGKPLGFFINKNRKGFEWYWMTNNWGKVGFTSKSFRAVLRNHKLNGKTRKIDPLLREVQYDNFSLTKKYLDIVIADINNKNIQFLHAYPSAAFILANTIKKSKIKTSLKTFLCGSENIFPFQKQLIQDDLNIRMYTWYGHSEKLILAGEGTVCENYHSIPFYGYTEIIDENDHRIQRKGATGELVGTGFINTKMPFIRYRTGDYAEYVGESCPDCGHIGLTFSKVKGRWKGDRIYKSDNTIITTTALNLHSNLYNFIQNIQYVQEEKGILEIRVVPEKNYTSSIREKIISEISRKVGSNLQINLKEVDNVEYSAINKFQLLIQKVKEDPIIGVNQS